jgi:hypothetical protein
MSTRQKKSFKAIAVFLALAVAQVYVQLSFAETTLPGSPVALPQQFIARLTTTGNQPISVNGASAISGASVLTGATIETPPGVGATVDLGPLGKLDIAPGTRVRLDFDCSAGPDNCEAKATVFSGCVILTTKKGTHGQVDTEQQQKAGESDKGGAGVLDICVGPTGVLVNQGAAAAAGAGVGAAAAAAGAAGVGGVGIGTAGLVAIGGGIAAVVGGLAWAFNNGPGNPSVGTP